MGMLVKIAGAIGAGIRAAADTSAVVATAASEAAKESYRSHVPSVAVVDEAVVEATPAAKVVGDKLGRVIGNTTGVVTKGILSAQLEIVNASQEFKEKVRDPHADIDPELVDEFYDHSTSAEELALQDRNE